MSRFERLWFRLFGETRIIGWWIALGLIISAAVPLTIIGLLAYIAFS